MKRVFCLFLLLSIIPVTVMAQVPEIGRIALYADSFRTVNEVDLPAPYTSFDLYIFCQPSVNGTYCAEFAIGSTNESMIVAATEWHPELSIVLGDMTTGVSACLLECQTDWFWISRVTMLNSNIEPATIEIVRHPDVGYYQFASCLEGSPIEPVFFGPGLYVNSSFTPDTDPPVPVSIVLDDDMRLTLFFDEKIFEPDALDPGSYLLYNMSEPWDTIPVDFVSFQAQEDRVWMVLGGHLSDTDFMMETAGIRDVAGNIPAPGTGILFHGYDTTPPSIINAYAPDDYTAVVVFSEDVTEASAEDLYNYSINCDGSGCTGSPEVVSAVLQPDDSMVVLTMDSQMEQSANYWLVISGITDLSGNVMDASNDWHVVPSDTLPPYVTKVSVVADTALAIRWSERPDFDSAVNLSNYSLLDDGPPAVPMTLTTAEFSSYYVLRLGFEPGIVDGSEYTLFVSGVMDVSMNMMFPDTVHIIPLDSIPPLLVDAECTGLQDIDLTFSEPIDPSMTGWESLFQVYPLGDPGALLDIDNISCYLDCTVLRLHMTAEMVTGAEYTVRVVNIRDLAGNSLPSQQRDFTCFDVYPPEVTGIFLSDLTHVNIQFDEAVNAAASDAVSYLLHEAADSTAVVDIVSAVLYDGATRVVLAAAAPLDFGELYTLKMNGIGDLTGNMIDPDTSWTFTAEDIVDPVLLNLTVTSDSIVHLEFNEPLDPVTAGDITKYAVVIPTDTSVSLPLQSATLDPTGTIVDLEIDGRGASWTPYVVWIMGVTDIAGNDLYTASDVFQFIDDIPPHLLYAEGTTVRSIIVFFDERVTNATAGDEQNYTLYPAGDPTSEIAIFQADLLGDYMSAKLLLSEDLTQDADYTLEVTGVMDRFGFTMEPASTDFHFLDETPPSILNVDLLNSTRLAIEFNEPVDSVTAVDTGNYLIYLSSDASQQIEVTLIDWTDYEVRLDLVAEPVANVDYTVRIDGIEDRFGNSCSEVEGTFRRVVYIRPANMALYVDENRSTNELETEVQYEFYSFYVFVEAGENGVFGAEYILSQPETYLYVGHENNPAWVASELGTPYSGHSLTLSMCAQDWFWVTRVNCLCTQPGEQEIVFIRPHPAAASVQIVSCLMNHPLEDVRYTIPLLINVAYVGVMIDNWDASFRNGGVELNWSIRETEATPVFEVSRTLDGSESWQRLPAELIQGNNQDFTITDNDFEPGRTYRYRLESIEDDGRKVLFETDAIATPVMPLALRQNSPNPFNPSTSIGFFLPQPGNVRLEIFDVNGRLIDVLANQHYASGEHSIDWNGTDRSGASVSSGVYFYRLTTGKESLSRKMVLLR